VEEVVACVLNAASVQVLPPAPTEVARITRPELGLTVLEKLERSVHWDRVTRDERVVVQPLARHEDDAGRGCSSARSRARGDGEDERDREYGDEDDPV